MSRHHKRNMFETISKECDLQALRDAIVSQNLQNAIATSDPITVFGPINSAFKKFVPSPTCGDLTQILLYHVVPQFLPTKRFVNDSKYPTLREGKSVRLNVYKCPIFNNVTTVNGVKIVEKNIYATNGVLQKINKVLCPPEGTIAQLVSNNPDFSILLAAVVKAGLVPALSDPNSSLTVFAPTNQAFENLLVELGITLQQLLDLPNLADILLYHVLGQTVFSVAIKEGKTWDIPTLNGKTVDFRRKCKKIDVVDQQKRRARVIGPDVLAENGVIHVIDKVLLP
jgi:transforming growth factor-beta-induced protein